MTTDEWEETLKQFDALQEELEDANYHRECEFIHKLKEFLTDNFVDDPNDLVQWILEYNWLS